MPNFLGRIGYIKLLPHDKVYFMTKIIFLSSAGDRHEVDVEPGYTLMEAAINNNIEGMVAECGGACACATCHAYIDSEWSHLLPEPDGMEDSMLDAAYERKETSRLACQLEVTEEWDGLVVQIADNDY